MMNQMMNQKTHQCISLDVKLGLNVRIFSHVNLYGCSIGDNTRIGAFVEIQKNVTIGKNCKISSHSFICEGVAIEDNVFLGHGVIFINDHYPCAVNAKGDLQTETDWVCKKTLVKCNASIGSGATLLDGIVIGECAMVGAGSVVTKDVLPYTMVAGNPAQLIRQMSGASFGNRRSNLHTLKHKDRAW